MTTALHNSSQLSTSVEQTHIHAQRQRSYSVGHHISWIPCRITRSELLQGSCKFVLSDLCVGAFVCVYICIYIYLCMLACAVALVLTGCHLLTMQEALYWCGEEGGGIWQVGRSQLQWRVLLHQRGKLQYACRQTCKLCETLWLVIHFFSPHFHATSACIAHFCPGLGSEYESTDDSTATGPYVCVLCG